jgi:hypothetical protein
MWSEELIEGPREEESMKGGGDHKRDRSNLTDLPSNTSSQKTGMCVCQLDRHVDKMTTQTFLTLMNKKFWIYVVWL